MKEISDFAQASSELAEYAISGLSLLLAVGGISFAVVAGSHFSDDVIHMKIENQAPLPDHQKIDELGTSSTQNFDNILTGLGFMLAGRVLWSLNDVESRLALVPEPNN